MREEQLRLFGPYKPLAERLGDEFFRRIPAVPGVYCMSGAQERILYVGQSANLKARLRSYKNANPDRAPRKVIRLIHEVRAITWETTGSALEARIRENELLRLHRPKYNRVNTHPEHYPFLTLRHSRDGLELGFTVRPAGGAELFGAFKTGAVRAYGALLRLTWDCLRRASSMEDYPLRFLSVRPPRAYRFAPPESGRWIDEFVLQLRCLLRGHSRGFLELVQERLPPEASLNPFQQTLRKADLEGILAFYETGPARIRAAQLACTGAAADLTPQDQLDDWLVLGASVRGLRVALGAQPRSAIR